MKKWHGLIIHMFTWVWNLHAIIRIRDAVLESNAVCWTVSNSHFSLRLFFHRARSSFHVQNYILHAELEAIITCFPSIISYDLSWTMILENNYLNQIVSINLTLTINKLFTLRSSSRFSWFSWIFSHKDVICRRSLSWKKRWISTFNRQ